jgi:hypothetical protein
MLETHRDKNYNGNINNECLSYSVFLYFNFIIYNPILICLHIIFNNILYLIISNILYNILSFIKIYTKINSFLIFPLNNKISFIFQLYYYFLFFYKIFFLCHSKIKSPIKGKSSFYSVLASMLSHPLEKLFNSNKIKELQLYISFKLDQSSLNV